MAYLKQAFGDQPDPITHPLTGDALTIGRHESCDVVIQSPSVSRHHARITAEGSRYFVEDLGSRNGTILNGRAISRKTPLSNGDRLEVSTLPFVFFAQDSLDGDSGNWGYRPTVISVSDSAVPSQNSAARHTVERGDEISYEQLGRDQLRDSQILSRVSMIGIDESGSGPVAQDAGHKLAQALKLTHGLRRAIRTDEILGTVLESLFEFFSAAECVAVITRNRTRTGLVVAAAAAREKNRDAQICLPVLHHSMECFEAILFVDYWQKPSESGHKADVSVARYILSAPLVGRSSEAFGAIQVDTGQTDRSFSQSELEQLAILIHIISAALENAAEVDLEVARALVDRGLEDASRLRASLGPLSPPGVPGFRWGHQIIAAPDIAADLIDYATLSDGRIACLLIDVPGRGSEAAGLLVCLTRLLIGAIVETESAAAALRTAERELQKRIGHVPMITSVGVLILDPKSATVSVTVAGHCIPVRIRDGITQTVTDDAVVGPPIGTGRPASGEGCILLEKGDSLVLFSDGVSKLIDPTGRMMSGQTLVELVDLAGRDTGCTLDIGLRVGLEKFRNGCPVPDDVAFVCVQRLRSKTKDSDEGSQSRSSTVTKPWKGSETWDMQ
ncbi:MAG: FHA domain-containing protein [Planctomycetaceae bacterium]